jgi:hypothetical protein
MAYTRSVVALLWPPPATARLVVTVGRAKAATDREWVVFPTPGTPRTLIPTGLPGAATMLERQQEDRRLSGRIARSAVGWATRSGLTGWLPLPRLRVTGTGESIETFLSAVLGEPVAVGVLLGTWRANRKPVLRIFGAGGDTLGFAKVGHNDLTRELVRREADNLRGVGASPGGHLQTPELIHHQRWRGLEVLVMSALTHPVAAEADFERLPLEAMHELSILGGTQTSALASSGYVERLQGRLVDVEDRSGALRLSALLDRVLEQHGDDVIEFGSWHGDWAAWNMAWVGGRVQLWDWERFERHVPLGFDVLHYRMQSVRHQHADGHDGAAGVFAAAPDLLEQVGVPAHLAAATIVLYLAEICARYMVAAQGDVGAPLRPRATWMLGLLETQLERQDAPANQKGRPA